MSITDVQWQAYSLPLRTPFTTTHGTITAREGVIVQILTSEGIYGTGEIAPLPSFRGEHLKDALALLPALTKHLHGKALTEALAFLSTVPPSTATSGLEMALLDALGKAEKRSIAQLIYRDNGISLFDRGTSNTCRGLMYRALDGLMNSGLEQSGQTGAIHQAPTELELPRQVGPSSTSRLRKHLKVNTVVGPGTKEQIVSSARQAVASGFSCIKLKVGTEKNIQAEIERIAAVRDAIGPAIHLRLDANEAWSLDQAIERLSALAQFDIQYIEQPLPANELDNMRILRQSISIPLAADEAISDRESAYQVLEQGAADILIIKPQLACGLRIGQQIIAEAAGHNVQCVITSSIESGIGVAAALHLAAACPEVTLECGLATLNLLADDLICEELVIRNGIMSVPAGDGLGVEVDREALKRYTI